jgi:cell division protein FtsW
MHRPFGGQAQPFEQGRRTYMEKDRLKQLKRLGEGLKKGVYTADSERYSAGRQSDRSKRQPPPLRAPGLPPVEQLKPSKQLVRSSAHTLKRRQTGQNGRTSSARRRNGSLAAEETIQNDHAAYKSLPRQRERSKVSNAHIPASEKSGRALQHLQFVANAPTGSRQVHIPSSKVVAAGVGLEMEMSEEEQRKLHALEMQLPRVAGKIDSLLLVIILTLFCIGLVMVYSASSFVAAQAYGDASYFFQRQLLGGLLGLVAMFVTMRTDYRKWRRFSLTGMAIVLPLLLIVLLFGTQAYGASRWLQLGPFSFQPSELVKLVLALYIADWLARKGNQVSTFWYGLAPFVIMVGLIVGLVLLENDMGTAIVIGGLATAMFFSAGANILQFCLAMVCGGFLFLIQAFHGYRYYRLIGFLNPLDPAWLTNINLQLYQSLLALGSGGFLGIGLGASRQKTGFLFGPHVDSIFAIIGEELGFFGGVIVLLLFVLLAFRGFRLARRTQDIYGALLATGITTWLVLQAMVNIGSTTASIPYTGVPLPFISYGGTSLVVSLAAVGVLLNISRYSREPEDPLFSRSSITRKLRKKVSNKGGMSN